MAARNGKAVFIVDGARTPLLRVRNRPGPLSAADLAVAAGRPLLARHGFEPWELDQVIVGNVLAGSDGGQLARSIALRLDCGHRVPAYGVQRHAGSGLQALDSAALQISCGRADLILAGGTESMSHAPLLFTRGMSSFISTWRNTPAWPDRLRLLLDLRPSLLRAEDSLALALFEPEVAMSQGQCAEELAAEFGLERARLDAYAVQSHRRAGSALAGKRPREIEPVFSSDGNLFSQDDNLQPDLDPAALARLRPAFDTRFGRITHGNSAPIADGAAWLLLASEAAVKRYQLPVLGRLHETVWCGVDPRLPGLGPAHAVAELLKRHRWGLKDIDYWELAEDSSAQVLACIEAWMSRDYCRQQLGKRGALGELDLARVNIDGGAIALGQPLGASSARIVLHLLHVLNTHSARRGVAAVSVGGGQGGAVLVEGRQAS